MLGLFIIEKNKLGFLECEVPQIGEYEALVEILSCGICNSTDWKIIEGRFKKGPFPILLGHESVGRIVKTGKGVRNYKEGDLVLRPRMYDKDLSISGSVRFGGFAEMGVVTDVWAREGVPYNSIAHPQQKIPKSISAVQAASLITLKENLSSVKNTGVGPGESLAIVGTGPVAQTMVVSAKLLGISPIAVFGRQAKWADKFYNLGADWYVSGTEYPDDIFRLLDRGGFDKVIEAVGSQVALSKCIEIVKNDGLVNLYGMPADDEVYEEDLLKDPRIDRARVSEAEVHDEMLHLVEDGTINLDDWVSHVLPWEEYEYGFNQVKEKKADKVILKIN
jgi:threonine dehydrogenase-like Zn-dependent dehydrogenase